MSSQDFGQYNAAARQNGINLNANEPFTALGTVTLPAGTTIGGSSVSALGTITSASANSFTVGRQGTTNPAFNVDSSTGSQVSGLNVVGGTSTGTVALSAISSGATQNLTIDSKSTGLLSLNATGTGNVVIGHGLTGTPQSLSGAGAINVTSLITNVTTTGANALTLADGVNGQIKIIANPVSAGTGTLTPTTKTGYTTIAFTAAGQGVVLVFVTTQGWICVGNNGATLS